MAVLALIQLDGTPDALLEMYDQQDRATRDLPTTGLVSHVVARTASGLTIVDVWESAELLEEFMAQPEFRSSLEAAGLPEPRVEVLEVDRRR
jgi:quinol monooxygenase YgiN